MAPHQAKIALPYLLAVWLVANIALSADGLRRDLTSLGNLRGLPSGRYFGEISEIERILELAANLIECLGDATQKMYVQSDLYPSKCCFFEPLAKPCNQEKQLQGDNRPRWPKQQPARGSNPQMLNKTGDSLLNYVLCTNQMRPVGPNPPLPRVCCRLSAFKEKCSTALRRQGGPLAVPEPSW